MSEFAIYHESQESGFCGKHCLNNLIQAPMFGEVELSQIALELDEQERNLMAQNAGGVDSHEYLKFLQENENPNVSLDGNFSIQVLSKALEIMGLQCIRIGSRDAANIMKDASQEQAFICNLQAHWFAIRKLGAVWYNLNSLKKCPEIISDFYLSAYLDTLSSEGYDIFAVRGSLPHSVRTTEGSGKWYSLTEIQVANAQKPASSTTQETDPEVRAAIAASLKDIGEGSTDQPTGDDDDLKKALEMSLQDQKHPNAMSFTSSSSSSSSKQASEPNKYEFPSSGGYSLMEPQTEEDKELEKALKMSVEEDSMFKERLLDGLPAEPAPDSPSSITIMIQLPNGTKLKRRFSSHDNFGHIFQFVNAQEQVTTDYNLVTTFPRTVFGDPSQTIGSARLGRSVMLRTETVRKQE